MYGLGEDVPLILRGASEREPALQQAGASSLSPVMLLLGLVGAFALMRAKGGRSL